MFKDVLFLGVSATKAEPRRQNPQQLFVPFVTFDSNLRTKGMFFAI